MIANPLITLLLSQTLQSEGTQEKKLRMRKVQCNVRYYLKKPLLYQEPIFQRWAIPIADSFNPATENAYVAISHAGQTVHNGTHERDEGESYAL